MHAYLLDCIFEILDIFLAESQDWDAAHRLLRNSGMAVNEPAKQNLLA